MPLNTKGKKIMKSMKKTYGKKKAKEVFYASKNKGKLFGVEKSGKAKPIKALTGLEVALISGALTAGAQMAMAPKAKGFDNTDPFKKVTNMNPQQFITDNTNASKMTQSALNPVTSEGESMVKETAQNAIVSREPIDIMPAGSGTLNEDTQQMKRGGSVRGVRIAQRGYKKIRVL